MSLSPVSTPTSYNRFIPVTPGPGSYLAPGTGKSQTGYWWAYRNIHTSTVYFDWHTSRAMDCLLDMLGFDEESKTLLFTGHIQCDGYKAYDTLVKRFKGIVLAGCMAHLRRKFFDARKQAPDYSIPVLLKIQEKKSLKERI